MNIIIVGASSGIGMATAREFLRLGHRVGVAARRTAPLLALQAEYPTQVVFAAIDINAPEAATRLLQLTEDLGGMDVYLHSSGAGHETRTQSRHRTRHRANQRFGLHTHGHCRLPLLDESRTKGASCRYHIGGWYSWFGHLPCL